MRCLKCYEHVNNEDPEQTDSLESLDLGAMFAQACLFNSFGLSLCTKMYTAYSEAAYSYVL